MAIADCVPVPFSAENKRVLMWSLSMVAVASCTRFFTASFSRCFNLSDLLSNRRRNNFRVSIHLSISISKGCKECRASVTRTIAIKFVRLLRY